MQDRFGKDSKVLYAQGSSYVAGFPVTVPRTVLRTGNDAGLKGEYFNNAGWQGQPVLTRVDKQVDFDWNAASPAEGIPAAAFSVRWSGSIAVPGAGDYIFQIGPEHCSPCDGVDKYRLYLDDKLVMEAGRTRRSPPATHPSPRISTMRRRMQSAWSMPTPLPCWRRGAPCMAARSGHSACRGGPGCQAGRCGRGLRRAVAEPGRRRDAGAPGGL